MILGRGGGNQLFCTGCASLSSQPSKVPTPQLRQVKRSSLRHTGIEPAHAHIIGFGRLRFSHLATRLPLIASMTSARVSYPMTGLHLG